MHTFVVIIHALSCIGLIAFVLLQSGKSAGLSGAIAGGGEAFFGKKKGLDALFSKLSTAAAVLFLVTALALSFVK